MKLKRLFVWTLDGRSNRSKSLTIFWSGTLLVQLLAASYVVAEETTPLNPSVLRNIGFESTQSANLKKKFPVCDAFLKVTWIDRQKKIGYSSYEYFYDDTDARKIALALVDIDEYFPDFTYDLAGYKKDGRLEEIFSFIRRGKVYFADSTLSIVLAKKGPKHSDIKEDFLPIEDFSTLARDKLNVCIAYPNGKRMWIAEGKPKVDASAVEKCEPSRVGGFYFTTDGKDIFLNNVCKVTKPEKRP